MSQIPALEKLDRSLLSSKRTSAMVFSIVGLGVLLFLFIGSNLPSSSSIFKSTFPKSSSYASSASFVCSPCVADVDGNHVVGSGDLTNIGLCQNKSADSFDDLGNSCSKADVNRDGVVNKGDSDCVTSQFDRLCQ